MRTICASAVAAASLLLFTGAARAQGLTMDVLRFDGRTGYVELPGGLVDTLAEATVEAWVKWDRLGKWSRVFDFGRRDNSAAVRIEDASPNLTFVIFDRDGKEHRIRKKDAIVTGVWYHVAAACGGSGMRLYLNGELVGTDGYRGGLDQVAGGRLFVGRSNWPDDDLFDGRMAEFRVWSRALDREEIAAHMDRLLNGSEAGLVAYWPLNQAGEGTLPGRGPHRLTAAPVGGVTVAAVPAIARFLVPGELEKAAALSYRAGVEALQGAPERGDRSGYVTAYRHFEQVRDLVPGYRDADRLMGEAAANARYEIGLFLFGTGRSRAGAQRANGLDDAWWDWETRRREVQEDLTENPADLRRLQADVSDYVYREVWAGKPSYARVIGLPALHARLEDDVGPSGPIGSAEVLNAARAAGTDVVVMGEFTQAAVSRRHTSDERRAYTVKQVTEDRPEGGPVSREAEDQAYTYHVVDQDIRLEFGLFFEVIDAATGRVLDRGRLSVEDQDGARYVNWENPNRVRAGNLYRRKRDGFERLPYDERKLFGARRTVRSTWPMALNAAEALASDLSVRVLKALEGYAPPGR